MTWRLTMHAYFLCDIFVKKNTISVYYTTTWYVCSEFLNGRCSIPYKCSRSVSVHREYWCLWRKFRPKRSWIIQENIREDQHALRKEKPAATFIEYFFYNVRFISYKQIIYMKYVIYCLLNNIVLWHISIIKNAALC